MLFRGTIIGPASGKLNGMVASHNRGGQYFRVHTIPTDPATGRQLKCRDALAQAYNQWRDNSPQIRQDWQNYAQQMRRVNRLGDEHHLTGWQEFSRWAAPRYQLNAQLGWTIGIGNAVAKIPEAALSIPPVGTIIDDGGTFRLTFDNTDFWVHDQDNALMLYLCSSRDTEGTRGVRALAPTRNYFRGPYQLVDAADGDPDDPIPSTIDVPLTIDAALGEKIFWRARLTTDDSGMSKPYEGVAIRTV